MYFRLITILILFCCVPAYAGNYTDSAHGSPSYGVNRKATNTLGYSQGNCAHCHEMHASIKGTEPEPTGGPDSFLEFDTGYTDQANGFCFACHTDGLSSYQTAFSRTNYSYSYWAGGYTGLTCPDNIFEAFYFIDESGASQLNCGSSSGSSHKLTDIKTFISDRWGYTSSPNPCAACHDPHRAKRSWPVSRPSGHANGPAWQIWGDDSNETMAYYTSAYQAPYRYGSNTTYEPDGSTIQDGSNLPDYVTFCTDCHNSTNLIYSNVLGRYLRTIDWANEKHGKGDADGYAKTNAPYSGVLGKVLACTDCHEPHGAPNVTLIRDVVNGGELAAITTISSTDCSGQITDHNDEMKALCSRCHDSDYEMIHHSTINNDGAYYQGSCSSCHVKFSKICYPINCNCCHYHGSSRDDCYYPPATRRTF